MNPPRRVAKPPSKPVLIYDGDCGFCVRWVSRWRQATGEAVEYLALQEERTGGLYPELPHGRLKAAVHFVDTEGIVYEGAEAVFRLLATNPTWSWALGIYKKSSLAAGLLESGYRFVARHRSFFSWCTRALWGEHVQRAQYFLVRRLFLSGLAMIYLVAFVSLCVQVSGLIGSNGILPAANFMEQAHKIAAADGMGLDRFRQFPTLCWLSASDGFLKVQCAAGSFLALLLLGGVAPPLCLVLLWVLYLSLTSVGGDFLAFQWDNLLLETGFLAIFFAPHQWLPRAQRQAPPSRAALWLLRLLLFKLMFLSGVVKLASGDPSWRNFTALMYHYQTQPLPNGIAWYACQLPLWFQKSSCAVMFFVELGIPFFIFLPRRLRMAGGTALALLQLLILLTGNYTFFNWLTLALCLLLLDDFALAKRLPGKLVAFYARAGAGPQGSNQRDLLSPALAATGVEGEHFIRPDRVSDGRGLLGLSPAYWGRLRIVPVAIIFVSVSVVQILAPLGALPRWVTPVVEAYRWLSPLRSLNSYGLFAVMTTHRPEIIVEGSENGRDWKAYEFPYKPGDVHRRPPFVAPYQPRLDWQMWFAALGDYRQNPWFINFCIRLLQGSPQVLALLETNPFPQKPPRYIRAQLYEYRFTTSSERHRTGAWWTRTLQGQYLPPISLDLLRRSAGPPAGDRTSDRQ